jgi:hypothetical protein
MLQTNLAITITGQKLHLFLWLATNFGAQIDKAFA